MIRAGGSQQDFVDLIGRLFAVLACQHRTGAKRGHDVGCHDVVAMTWPCRASFPNRRGIKPALSEAAVVACFDDGLQRR